MRTKSSFHRPVVDALFLTFLVASLAFLFKRKKNRQPASSSTSAAALLDSTVDSSLEDAADAAFVAGGDANALAAEWARNSAEAAEVEFVDDAFIVSTFPDGSRPVNPDTLTSVVRSLCVEPGQDILVGTEKSEIFTVRAAGYLVRC